MPDPKLEYLVAVQQSNELIQQVLAGAELIQQGGAQGLIDVVNIQPEVVLEAFNNLADLIRLLQEDKLAQIEEHLTLLDQIDKLTST